MTSESWISLFTRGKYVFLNPTLLSKSFNLNIMIFVIIFSSNCRAFASGTYSFALLGHLEARSITLVELSLFFHYHIYQELFLTNTKHGNTSFAPFGSSCGRCIHSCLRINYKDNLSYKLGFLETIIHHNIYSVGFHELRCFPILKWVIAY